MKMIPATTRTAVWFTALILLAGCAQHNIASLKNMVPFPSLHARPETEVVLRQSMRPEYEAVISEPPPSTLPPHEIQIEPSPPPEPPQQGAWHRDIIATCFDLSSHRRPRTAWNEHNPLTENRYYLALPFNDQLPGNEGYGPCENRWLEIVNVTSGVRAYGQWKDVGPWFANDADYVFDETGTVRPFAEVHKGQRFNVYRESRQRPRGRRPRKILNAAGIDISPELADTLDIVGKGRVHWRFVDEQYVPDGPWKHEVLTQSRP
ncbi:MAG: hypothetical protein ABIH23_12220 [bacterium]